MMDLRQGFFHVVVVHFFISVHLHLHYHTSKLRHKLRVILKSTQMNKDASHHSWKNIFGLLGNTVLRKYVQYIDKEISVQAIRFAKYYTWMGMHVGCSKSNASYWLPWKVSTDTKSTITLLEQIRNNKTLILNTGTTMSYASLPAKNKSLNAALVKTCTSRRELLALLLKCTTHQLTVRAL